MVVEAVEKGGKALLDGAKKVSSKVKEGVSFVASKIKGLVNKVGDLWNKGKTTVKNVFVQADKKVRHAVKTLMEFDFNFGRGPSLATRSAGAESRSLKDTYQYMRDTGERVVGSGEKNVGKGVSEAKQTLSNVEEAHQWGSKHFDNWIESLTESERKAIRQYTGSDYSKINNYLRGITDSLDGIGLNVIDDIKRGLNKANVPHGIQVYRGTDLKPFKNLYKIDDEGKIIVDSLVGKTIKDNGFVSTAMVKESSFGHMNVSWEINVFKGSNAAYVGKISQFPGEAELLLNSGQEMIIKSASVDSAGKIHLVLDLLG